MVTIRAAVGLTVCAVAAVGSSLGGQNAVDIKPTPQQVAWQDPTQREIVTVDGAQPCAELRESRHVGRRQLARVVRRKPEHKLRAPADSLVVFVNEFVDRLQGTLVVRMRQHATAEADAALDGDAETWWEPAPPKDGNHMPAVITVRFAQPTIIDRTVVMERLKEGQHITRYAVDVEEGSQWREVAQGQAIGHKKIDILPPVAATAVRLRVLAASGPIQIREFQVYNGTAAH